MGNLYFKVRIVTRSHERQSSAINSKRPEYGPTLVRNDLQHQPAL